MAGKITLTQLTYKVDSTIGATGIAEDTVVTYGTDADSVKPAVAATVVPVGVVMNDERVNDALRAPGNQTGRQIAVMTAGVAKLVSGAAITKGTPVMVNASGKMIAATVGNYALGIAENATTAADQEVFVRIQVMKV
jgi:hypothetical protein